MTGWEGQGVWGEVRAEGKLQHITTVHRSRCGASNNVQVYTLSGCGAITSGVFKN